jgi:8-oxo-dGTP pyrophosphatase MutT (NUDIX family)
MRTFPGAWVPPGDARRRLCTRSRLGAFAATWDGQDLCGRLGRTIASAAALFSIRLTLVLPGGGVDAGEAAEDAARREVEEETGIALPESVKLEPLCAWESAFPTTVAKCRDAGGLKRQHIVVYYVARISGTLAAKSRRGLQWDTATAAEGIGTEVDCACWLPVPAAADIGGGEAACCDALGLRTGVAVEALAGDGSTATTVDAGAELRGIWPNENGGGITRGAFFALAMLARAQCEILVPGHGSSPKL